MFENTRWCMAVNSPSILKSACEIIVTIKTYRLQSVYRKQISVNHATMFTL